MPAKYLIRLPKFNLEVYITKKSREDLLFNVSKKRIYDTLINFLKYQIEVPKAIIPETIATTYKAVPV